MLTVFSTIFVAVTKIILSYNFGKMLKEKNVDTRSNGKDQKIQ